MLCAILMCAQNLTASHLDLPHGTKKNKNSSGDELANVNFYAVRPGNYLNSLK